MLIKILKFNYIVWSQDNKATERTTFTLSKGEYKDKITTENGAEKGTSHYKNGQAKTDTR
ncbi:hypothetical protein PV326_001160, partial [Microctonus aethiopoides]